MHKHKLELSLAISFSPWHFESSSVSNAGNGVDFSAMIMASVSGGGPLMCGSFRYRFARNGGMSGGMLEDFSLSLSRFLIREDGSIVS